MGVPQVDSPLSFGSSLAGVPHLDQYWGAWALDEAYAKFLVSHARNINLQVHLEQHVAMAAGGGGRGRGGELLIEDGIATIELSGTLMKHVSSMTAGTSTALARRQVRAAAASPDVRGILLVIDSPGGTVAGTTDLAADIRAAGSKKPVFAFIEDCGASGAYWLASQAQRVSANATALVGSIGVFTVVEDTSQQAASEGVKVHVVRFGAMKGMGTPGTPVTDDQLAYLQERIDGFAEDFMAAIASGRRMSREAVLALTDGRVHKGAAAKNLGLVDSIETIDDTLALLIAECNKSRSSSRTKTMSEPTTATLESTTPSAATIAELREVCPGASSDFLLGELDKKATVAEAMKAHAKTLTETNAALTKERDELKTKADEAAKQPKTRGVAPLGGDAAASEGGAEFEGGPKAFLLEQIEIRQAKGLSREKAARAVYRTYPTLQAAVVAEANEGRRAA